MFCTVAENVVPFLRKYSRTGFRGENIPSVLNTAILSIPAGYSSTELRAGIQTKDINFKVIRILMVLGIIETNEPPQGKCINREENRAWDQVLKYLAL